MKLKTIVIIVSVCGLVVCDQEVDYFTNLITENVLKSQNYVLPTYYKGFEIQEKEKEPIVVDFGTYDFIIVGGGTAGNVLTRRLSEIKKWKILLLEGGSRGNDFTDIPGVARFLTQSDFNWGFNTTTQKYSCKGYDNAVCSYPRGKGLGGTTLINSNIHLRGTAADYDKWAQMGLREWSFDNVLPYFKKYENAALLTDIDKDFHGFKGPVNVEPYKNASSVKQAYIETLKSMNHTPTDPNGRNILGFSVVQQSTNKGRRHDSASAYLKKINYNGNVKIQLNSLVTKVLIDGSSRTTGVEFIHNNTKYVAHVTKEVILSAGTVGSPQILMLSGIGPHDELSKHNISIIHDLPVGKYLHDQCTAGISATTNFSENLNLQSALRDYLNGYGSLTSASRNEVFTFTVINDYLVELIYLDDLPLDVLNDSIGFLNDFKQISIYAVLLHPKSTGTITLASNNPLDFPLIDPNVLSESEDVEALIESLNYISTILESESLKQFNVTPIVDETYCKEFAFKTRDYWKCVILNQGIPAYHVIGTCRMGTNTTNSVVNQRLLVHGMENLRVVDASVVPSTISGHLFGTTYMVAEKAADIIKEQFNYIKRYWF